MVIIPCDWRNVLASYDFISIFNLLTSIGDKAVHFDILCQLVGFFVVPKGTCSDVRELGEEELSKKSTQPHQDHQFHH